MDINKVLMEGVAKGASDIHFAVGLRPYIRVNGELVELSQFSEATNDNLSKFFTPNLSKEQKDQFAVKKGLDLSYQTPDLSRFRINIHIEKGNFGLVARVIPSHIPTMEEIELPNVLYKMMDLKTGLILVTGPAGAGKSTSLAAMVNKINQDRKDHIVTLEDPIEFLHKPINCIVKQRELGRDIPSFSEGLKQCLREDINVVMVGEMRDLETISTTITVAETGHLVMATLHTDDTAQTIDRIIDAFPVSQQDQIRMQLSLTLRCVLSQRLIPKVDGGRLPLREILVNTPAIANLIRENKIPQIKNVVQTHMDLGMVTFDQSLQNAYNDKLISKETALQYIKDPMLIE